MAGLSRRRRPQGRGTGSRFCSRAGPFPHTRPSHTRAAASRLGEGRLDPGRGGGPLPRAWGVRLPPSGSAGVGPGRGGVPQRRFRPYLRGRSRERFRVRGGRWVPALSFRIFCQFLYPPGRRRRPGSTSRMSAPLTPGLSPSGTGPGSQGRRALSRRGE